MKQLTIMITVVFIINVVGYMTALFVDEKLMYIIYRAVLLCNIALFTPSLSLIHKENKKNKKKE